MLAVESFQALFTSKKMKRCAASFSIELYTTYPPSLPFPVYGADERNGLRTHTDIAGYTGLYIVRWALNLRKSVSSIG